MNEKDRSSRQRDELESLRWRVRELEAALGKKAGDDRIPAPDDKWLRTVMKYSPDGIDICKYDLKTGKRTLIACNDRYVQMSGRSREELISSEHLDPWVRDISSLGAYDPEHNEFPWRGIASWFRPDGRENYFEWTAAHAVIGDVVYIVSVSRDITAGERREEVLARGEYWFKSILENSLDGINICKYDRRTHKRTLIMCNDRYVEMSGRSREELMAADHLDPLVKTHSFSAFGELGPDKRTRRSISSWIRPDGKENYYEWTATYLFLGDDLYSIGVDRDITEHRRVDEALGESEHLYRTTIDAMSDPIHVVDADLRLTLFNTAFAQFCGGLGLATEAVGKNLFEALPFLPDKVRREYRRVFETGEPLASEEVTSMGGRQFVLEVRKVPILEDGKVVRVITVIHDITERRRINDAMRRSEAKYRTLTENVPQKIFTKDRDSVYVSCNQSFARVLKIDTEELPGKTDYDFCPRELAEKYITDDKRIMQSGKVEDIEERFVENGKERIVHTVKTPIKDEKGNVVGVLGIFWDVTEQKRAEEALRASEQTALALLNGTPDIAFLMTPDGVVVALNEAMARNIGKPLNECVGMNFRDMLPPDLLKQRIAWSDEVVHSGKPLRFEDERNGMFLDHSVYPVFDAEGKVSQVAIFARDITERRRAEAAVREAKEHLQYVFDNTWDIIFEVDPEGNYTFCNQAAERITGYTQEEILRMNMRELMAPEWVEPTFDRMRKRIAGEALEQPFNLEILHKDGQTVSLELTTSAAYRDGKPAAIQGIARDVTERKQAEEVARTAQHKLMTAREYERRHLARELHDTAGQRAVALHYAIQNVLERARDRLDEELLGLLEDVSGGCNEVVRELRHISHGLYPPTLETLGLAPTLRQLARNMQGGIEVTVSCSKTLESVRFCEEVEIALFRIAQEALNNALRHSKATRVELRLARKADRLHLTITDNGRGFSPGKADGRGLGLTSMRERAQAIGGQLDISSRKGNTRVRVTVAEEPSEPRPGGSGKDNCELWIDD